MKKARVLTLVAVVLTLGMSLAIAQPPVCGTTVTQELYQGRKLNDVGDVHIWNNEDNIFIKIVVTADDWYTSETKVAICGKYYYSDYPYCIPQNRAYNPKPGHFPFQAQHIPPVKSYTYEIPRLWDLDSDIYVAVHAELYKEDGGVVEEESAWAGNTEFWGRNWARYFIYHIQVCEQPES